MEGWGWRKGGGRKRHELGSYGAEGGVRNGKGVVRTGRKKGREREERGNCARSNREEVEKRGKRGRATGEENESYR